MKTMKKGQEIIRVPEDRTQDLQQQGWQFCPLPRLPYSKEGTMVTIEDKEYTELKEESRLFQALQRAGVDNWEGYDMAMEELAKDE